MSSKKAVRPQYCAPKGQAPDAATSPDAAFDLWLERSLHALYDDVAKEPIPRALRALIEADRKKA